MAKKKKKALKFDAEKLRMDLIPPEVVESLAKVLGYGAAKYGENNYQAGIRWSRYYAALLRHLFAWWGGEDDDPESGFHHLDHVLANAAILLMFVRKGAKKWDDRPGEKKKPEKHPQIGRAHV